MKSVLTFIFLILLSINYTPAQNKGCYEKDKYRIDYSLSLEENQLLDSLQYYSFQYFLGEMNPKNGLIRDRSAQWSPASTAAMGFGLVAWGIGVEHKWISRDEAKAYTLAMLHFLLNSNQSTDTNATGYKGLYYHFLRMESGTREWKCELSTIDTGLLLAGLLFAQEYYNLNVKDEVEIRTLIDTIIKRIDWDFITLDESVPDKTYKNTLSMAWAPEEGFSKMGWAGYNEGLLLYIIAAGTGMTGAEKAYDQWLKNYRWETPYSGLGHVTYPPLFVHQYPHMFIDFRGIGDKFNRESKIDYFENSRRATLTQYKYAIENPKKWVGYDSLSWGLSACDGPGDSFNTKDWKFNSYAARGSSGPQNIHDDDGTIAPTATAGSIVFAPEIVIPTLNNITKTWGNKGLWGKYGLKDSFNPTLNWVCKDYLGIDQGPFVIMIENLRTGLVWEKVMQNKLIQKGLSRLDFKKF